MYKKLLRLLKKGDIMFIKNIDRLGRNYDDILGQWRKLTKEKEIDIVILDMSLFDTRKKNDFMGTVIADIVLELLSYVAQTEREFIRHRQAEGIVIAKEKGIHFSRKPMEKPEKFEEARKRWAKGEISARAAGKELGVHHQTFLRWERED